MTKKDLLFISTAYANALSFFIPKGTGIVADLQENRIDGHPEITKVIIQNKGTMLVIEDVTNRTDLKDGSLIQIIGNESKN